MTAPAPNLSADGGASDEAALRMVDLERQWLVGGLMQPELARELMGELTEAHFHHRDTRPIARLVLADLREHGESDPPSIAARLVESGERAADAVALVAKLREHKELAHPSNLRIATAELLARGPAGRERPDLTDAGNGQRFAVANRATLRFDAAAGAWRYFDGERWVLDETGHAMRGAKAVVRTMFHEAADLEGMARDDLLAWAKRSESRERLLAMIDLARSEDDITITAEQWDADLWAFNVANGTIDLRTGTLEPHRSTDLITKLAPVKYDANAEAPRFMSFLREIFAADPELTSFIKRVHGYALAGIRPEHVVFIYHGDGANGKSTLLEAISYVSGDYADTAPPDLLTERRGFDEHPCEIADLRGKRLIVASETEKNRRLRVQLVKRLSGDAMLKGRYMRQNYFTFPRSFVIVLVTNNLPRVDEDSEATWRRMKLVPFRVTIPAAQRDKGLPDRLKVEASGILNWLIQGCLEWQRDGLGEPPSVEAATETYRAESDPLADFIAACCIVAPNAWASSADLRAAYELYCRERGDHPLQGRDWTDALGRHADPDRKHSGRGWSGIGLLTSRVSEGVEA